MVVSEAPAIEPVNASGRLPIETGVVVIGGGIVGLMAALALAERSIAVVVLDKGRIAGEQSSRNLGWIRKMGRSVDDLPLSIASARLWAQMHQRLGTDVGYRETGIMYISRTERELAAHARWLAAAAEFGLDSRMVTPAQIDALVPGGVGQWAGGIYTPSDGRAEPTLAASAVARALLGKGGVIIENCAVRTIVSSAGQVTGVATERGEVRCDHVLLAGGYWSRKFLANMGLFLPTLPVWGSVIRTAPMAGPTEIAVGAPDFSFRRRFDGGFTITQRGALYAPLSADHLLLGPRYIGTLRQNWANIRLSLGAHFFRDLALPRRWSGTGRSPFEHVRTLDPPPIRALNQAAMNNLAAAWPVFRTAVIEQAWGGMIDITPDSLPVISAAPGVSGLTVATGFSGHGFGTAPGAGQLAADLVTGRTPIVDPTPYRLDRFV